MTRTYWIFAALAALATGCSDRMPVGAGPSDRVAYSVDLGSAPRDAQLDFVLGLHATNKPLLSKFLDDQRFTNDVLSPEDFGEKFGVSAGEYARLATWLRANGLTVTRTVAGRLTISGSGTVAAIEQAFGVALHEYQDSDGRFIATVQNLSLSPEIAPSVGGIIGIDGGYNWKSHAVHAQIAPNAALAPYGAAQLENQYSTKAITNPGMGQTVAILGAGGAPPMSDLTSYITTYKPYGLTTYPGMYTQELVGGPDRTGDTPQGEQFENTLDIDMVVAMAPYAKVVHVITATNSPGLFADGITHIINSHPEAHAVTVSYGSCERGAAAEMPVLNALFMQAMAQGQQWFFAAGDTGTDGCRNGAGNTVASAGWPASSPYVVGVGGTQINAAGVNGAPATEVVWNTNATQPGAGGGGASESLDKPAFQMGVTPADGARDEPDVSALAGPPYINIFEQAIGGTSAVGGTSAATPIWAGVWALLEQAKNNAKITNALPELYMLGKTTATKTSFNDVVTGTNGGQGQNGPGGYVAAAGYDLATGWGTPNVPQLIANWQ